MQTKSNMLPLGTPAFKFELTDGIHPKTYNLNDLKGSTGTVLMFICNHCPFVQHIIDKLCQVTQEYKKRGFSFVAINSNDIELYPQDAPDKMLELSKKYSFTFPYLFDSTQEVAKKYLAACTPDFYVFDSELRCFYRGRFDGSTPSNKEAVTGKDLTTALDSILNKLSPSEKQLPSIGCNIKWK